MVRVIYKDSNTAEANELLESILARRGGNLLNLDRALLNSPAFAKGWNVLLGEVRGNLSLSPKIRELAICTVAVLNSAEYEWHHHLPEFLKAGGTEEQAKALQTSIYGAVNSRLFDATERAVLQLSIDMTKQIEVSTSTFANIRSIFTDDKQIIELIGVIATYNMVSRFLVAVGVEIENKTEDNVLI